MRMLTKFESRSSRAKAVAFHPKRPWVLVALYSSTIQLWDYRMGTVIERFEGHKGPVRGLDVHPTQDMFVSAGDDQLVRVWSLSDRRLLFTLEGHQDYVRTVFFHKTLPWIVSASDDQTVRIWDWQSRKEIATLTGHSHWVSCAVFHPTEDLVFSSSLDATVRSWDISGLVKRHSAAGVVPSQLLNGAPGLQVPGMPGSMPTGLNSSFGGGAFGDDNLLGEVTTNFVMDGHVRGVSWVTCHPTQPIVATASDDRTVKLWRFNGSVAWEMETFRGHRDEVTSVAFHPYNDTMISCSSDDTIRVWDLTSRTLLDTFQHFSEKTDGGCRYWGLRFHPKSNLIAAASDTGAEVFKFGRERPAHVTQPEFYAVGNDLQLRDGKNNVLSDYTKHTELKGMEVLGLSFNSAERTALTSFTSDPSSAKNGAYLLHNLNNGATIVGKTCKQALFVTRNRFCVLTSKTTMEIRDMEDKVTREIELPIETEYLGAAQQGHVLLMGARTVLLFDIQQKLVVAKIEAKGAKYVSWNPTGSHVAIMAKHQLVIANKNLELVATIDETIRLKSIAWDSALPIVVYSTFCHLKYALLNGDIGILRSLDETVYVISSSKSSVSYLGRDNLVQTVSIDPTEYRFKLALITHNFAEVSRLIQNSNLVGQSIIAYLQKRGYPEIALEFVQDPQTKLDLAIESGNLDIAAEVAGQLQGEEFDTALEKAALEQGNHDILEDVYLRQRAFDKLSFLYMITGNRSRLQRLEQLATQRGDAFAQFQISLFLNSPDSRINLLKQAGQGALAYAMAKSHGMEDEAEQILEENGKQAADVKVTTSTASDNELNVSHETHKQNWPVEKLKSVSIMDMAKLSISEGNDAGYEAPTASMTEGIEISGNDFVDDEPAAIGDEWDLDEELDEEEFEDAGDEPELASELPLDAWVRNSTLAADHIAAGSFETAGQLLSRQLGVNKLEVLKSRFMDVYSASKLSIDGHDGLAPVPVYVYRDSENKLPFIPGLESIQTKLNEAFTQVKSNQLELAVDSFRSILHTVATLAVDTEEEEAQVKKAVDTCKNYILAFSIEITRRKLSKDDVKRNLELAAYFTKPQLRSAHAVLPLRTAAVQASNAKNYTLASHFATEYLKIDTSSPHAEKMRKNKARWDSAKTLDAVDIDFDMFAEFDIDPLSLTPIYSGQPTVEDPLTHAKYHLANQGQTCAITGFTQVGATASGLRLRV